MLNGISNNSNNNIYNQNPYGGIGSPQEMSNPQNIYKTEKAAKAEGDYECKTCSERKYKDGSDDGGVSFQSPTNVSPGRSASAVFGHEREHFVRENAKAQREGKEVVSNTIKISYSVCPECGRRYASGGETRTVTKGKNENVIKKNEGSGSKYDFSI